ncbi:hypothetical protein GCM10009815_31860 [Nocardioides marmoribigeumensis]
MLLPVLLVWAVVCSLTTSPAYAVGSPPTPSDDSFTVVGTDWFDVLGNDSDPDLDQLTVTTTTQGAHGSVTCRSTGACSYTVSGSYTGDDSFTYTVSDGHANTATATVAVYVQAPPDSTNPPTPVPDELTTKAGQAVAANVLTNDNAAAGATMVVTANPSHGSVTCSSAGACTYTPTAGFTGYDGFGYDVTDSFGTSHGTALVTVVASTAGYTESASGAPASLSQGEQATWKAASRSTPANLPQQYAAQHLPGATTVSLTGPHAVQGAPVGAKGWTVGSTSSSVTATPSASALLGSSTTNPLPPPLPPISQGTGGDGHVPIIVGSRVFAFYHHTTPTSVTCIDRQTGGLCPGYPRQITVGTDDVPGPGAVVGTQVWFHPTSLAGYSSYAQYSPVSLYCWDSATDAPCGLAVVDRVETTSDVGASAPVVVAGKLWFGTETGKVYCVDPSTKAPCAGTASISVPMPTGTPQDLQVDVAAHGTRIFLDTYDSAHGGYSIVCADTATSAPCSGWSTAKSVAGQNVVNHHSPSGAADGVCAIMVEGSADPGKCWLDADPATAIDIPAWHVSEDHYSVSVEAEAGTRTLYAIGLYGGGMGCWDWTTGADCTGGRWTNGVVTNDSNGDFLPSGYGATFDGTCAVGLGDPGQVFTVDVNGTSPCTSLSAGGVRRVVDLRDQRCDGTTGAATWQDVKVVEGDLSAGGDFESLDVTVTDATTGAVLAHQEMVGTAGTLSLSGISAVAHPSLALDATAVKAAGKDPWADGNPPRLLLDWNPDPASVCFTTTTTIDCAAPATQNIGISALPAGGTAATAQLTLDRSSQCKQLTVSKAGSGSGTVTSDVGGISCGATCSAYIRSGTPVTLTAANAVGSVFTGWSGGGCSGTGTCVVTPTADTTVTATFVPLRTLTVTKNGTGSGTVVSTPAGISCGSTCSAGFPSGSSVTLTPTAAAGSVFTGWSGGGCTGTSACTLAPTVDTSVTATFAALRTLTVTRAGGGSGSVSSSPAGINCGATCSATFQQGTSVTLTATPAAGSTFSGWSGGGCSGTSTCTVPMAGDTSVTATFVPATATLTVSRAGAGSGTVTSNPAGIDCGSTCSTTFTQGTQVTLSAAASSGSVFSGWSGGGCTGTGTCVVTMSTATTVTATFAKAQRTLTVTKAGTGSGTVSSSPAGISCGATCATSYADGTQVTLTATPAAGSTFAGWSGGGCTGTSTCVVTMSADTTATATFTATQPVLTVAKAGTGTGGVTSSPAGIDCGSTCASSFASGTQVTLTATPTAGSVFAGWSGGGCTGTGTCVVTVTSSLTVTATFTNNQPVLSVTRSGSGSGTVTSNPAGIDCGSTCSAAYADGTSVTLSATPAAGSRFAGWSGGGCSGTGTCVVTVGPGVTVTATFVQQRTLTVTKAGSGSGTVTSNPAGIDCGSTCSAAYDDGTSVTLSADPAAGSAFTGWSGGGCSGQGLCTVTLASATSVTATFTPLVTLTVTRAGSGSGTVTSNPARISCPSTCTADFVAGTTVTLTATASAGADFTGWSGGGCSGTSTCVVTLTSATSVTATFTARHLLTVQTTGSGSVTSSPAGISCGATCTASFAGGSTVTLTPTAAAGWVFSGWTGACTGAGSCSVTMSTDRTVGATFVQSHTLTVTKAGSGSGSVTSSPAGISCGATCAKAFPAGTQVTLTAAPAAGSTFTGWSGGGCSGTSTCVVTMTGDTSVTATFTPTTHTLTVTRSGTGSGAVSSSPAGISCGSTCKATYPSGASVTLTAAPGAGSVFTGWGGACSGTAKTCVLTMGVDRSVTAGFAKSNQPPVAKNDGPYVIAPGGVLCVGRLVSGCTKHVTNGVLANDRDPDGTLKSAKVDSISFAAAEYTWYANGSFVYRAGAGTSKVLTKTITYHAVDNLGASSNKATVTIKIGPIGVRDRASVTGGRTLTVGAPKGAPGVGVLANDLLIPGTSWTKAVLISTTIPDGQLVWRANGSFTFSPRKVKSNLTRTIVYQGVDSAGHRTQRTTVTLSVLH